MRSSLRIVRFLALFAVALGSNTLNEVWDSAAVASAHAADLKTNATVVSRPAAGNPPTGATRPFSEQRSATSSGHWLVHPAPVLVRGELDSWDDFKVGYPVVLKEGNGYRMWYRGCHFLGMTYTCAIGHATAPDGVAWKKTREPVFVPADPVESRRLHSITLVRAGDYYWMWYSVDPDRYAGHPYATIHLATSRDGLTWTQRGAVARAMSAWTPWLEPSAHFDGKLFHLWYVDYPYDDDRTLVHVTSLDGAKWQQRGATSLGTLKVRPGRLSVTSDGAGGYRALFSNVARNESRAVDLLTSNDGSHWEAGHLSGTLATKDLGAGTSVLVAPHVLPEPDGTMVWLTLRPQSGAEEIRLAFLKGS